MLEVLLKKTDHARREALIHEQAVPSVLGRIGVEHHESARIHALCFAGELLGRKDGNAACFRREETGVAVHANEVLVLHDVPEALCSGILVPTHRIFGAESVEHFVVLETLEAVEVEEVDSLECHADPLDRC